MTRWMTVTVALCIGMAVLAPRAFAQGNQTEAVHQLLDRVENAWKKHDLEALKAECVEEGLVSIISMRGQRDGALILAGQKIFGAIAKMWRQRPLKSHSFVGRDIAVQGDIAWMRLTVADRVGSRGYHTRRALNLALKRGAKWQMCFSMPLFVSSVVMVTEPIQGSQAERLGIKRGDVVTAYAGHPIEDAGTLVSLVRSHANDGAEKKLVIEILRGSRQLYLDASPGTIGIRLEQRILPSEGAVSVAADEPHPIKKCLRDSLRALKAGDKDGWLRSLCPAGCFSLEPVPEKPSRIITRHNIRQVLQDALEKASEKIDINTLELVSVGIVVRGDVALVTPRLAARLRDETKRRVVFPTALHVYVRQNDKWWGAAALPVVVQAGLDADPQEKQSPAGQGQ